MGRISDEDKAGLYITVILHLAVIIVFLLVQIGNAVKADNSFVIDFSKQEAVEKLRAELERKEAISERIDRMLAEQGMSSGEPIRNVAVDRSSLKDDRGTDAEQLYKEAERLQNELQNGYQQVPGEDDVVIDKPAPKKEESKQDAPYKGPSVVSYQLDGRKASHLAIPAYRCMGGGEVTVIITVDQQGSVINAKIQEDVSSSDECLRSFAIRAARGSRFSASNSAPARQLGNIVYEFSAQ